MAKRKYPDEMYGRICASENCPVPIQANNVRGYCSKPECAARAKREQRKDFGYLTAEQREKVNNRTREAQSRNREFFCSVINQYKVSKGCEWPGGCEFGLTAGKFSVEYAVCFDLDHVNPAEKSFAVSTWVSRPPNEVNVRRMIEEIRKCLVLCRCHHALRTLNEGHNARKLPGTYKSREYVGGIQDD